MEGIFLKIVLKRLSVFSDEIADEIAYPPLYAPLCAPLAVGALAIANAKRVINNNGVINNNAKPAFLYRLSAIQL